MERQRRGRGQGHWWSPGPFSDHYHNDDDDGDDEVGDLQQDNDDDDDNQLDNTKTLFNY